MANNDLPVLLIGVCHIVENRSQWIGKNRSSFRKGYSVLLLIGSGFILIPFKL